MLFNAKWGMLNSIMARTSYGNGPESGENLCKWTGKWRETPAEDRIVWEQASPKDRKALEQASPEDRKVWEMRRCSESGELSKMTSKKKK